MYKRYVERRKMRSEVCIFSVRVLTDTPPLRNAFALLVTVCFQTSKAFKYSKFMSLKTNFI